METTGSWQAKTKVPRITGYFWIIKILTTAMGEATSDYFVAKWNPILAVGLGFLFFVAVLAIQFKSTTYKAWRYWLAAVGVSIFGTMAADVLHVQFHIPYAVSTIFYAIVLGVIFICWYKSEKTLSFHSIYTKRREAFYWATVLSTFALGTALGDFTATSLHLGYFTSGVVFGVVFALPALAYWRFRINAIFAFWFAYVITRPLGASFADWSGKAHSAGALGYGDGRVSLVLSALIVLLVGYLSITGKDLQSKRD